MSSFRIRPRFKHLVEGKKETVEEQLNRGLEASEDCVGVFLTGHFYLKIPLAERHFWSPQLHLTLEESEEGTIIRGLYGPNPTVWAIFFFGYVTVGILFFFLGMWGLTRWNLGMPADILWSLPILALVALGLYMGAQMGQKFGAEQMYRLHHFYENVIHSKISIS